MLIQTMWDLSHQRGNYLIRKSNSFGYARNCKFSYRQIMQSTVMNLWCECSLCHVQVIALDYYVFICTACVVPTTCDMWQHVCSSIQAAWNCNTPLHNSTSKCQAGTMKEKVYSLNGNLSNNGNFIGDEKRPFLWEQVNCEFFSRLFQFLLNKTIKLIT